MITSQEPKQWRLDSLKFLSMPVSCTFLECFCHFIFSSSAYFWICVSLSISVAHSMYRFHSPFHFSLSLAFPPPFPSSLTGFNTELFSHLQFCSVSRMAVHFQSCIFNSFLFTILKEDDWILFLSFSLKYKLPLSCLVWGWFFSPLWVSISW